MSSVRKDISVSLGLTLMLGHGLEPRLTTIAVVCQCIVFNPKLETLARQHRSVIRHGLASVRKDISVSLGLTLIVGHWLESRLTTIAVLCDTELGTWA